MKRIEFEYGDDYSFKKKEFKVYEEFQLSNGSWKSVCYGTFIVTEIWASDTKDTVKVVWLKVCPALCDDFNYSCGTVMLLQVL